MEISVGDVGIRVLSDEPYSPLFGDEANFLCAVEQPDMELEIRTHPERLLPPPDARLLFDGLPLWTAYARGDNLLLALWHGQDQCRLVEVDPATWKGLVHIGPEDYPGNLISRALRHPALLLLCAWRLVYKGGLMIHACGVNWQGLGLSFCGRSESGKTTTSRLWRDHPEAVVLNDDRVVFVPEGESFRMLGSPWYGDGHISHNSAVPLDRLFFLRHGSNNGFSPLTLGQTYAELYASALLPYYDRAAVALGLDTLERVAAAVPAAAYEFVPDQSALTFVQEHLLAEGLLRRSL